ncbi:fasciclin-like arabinogalactan protein 4 [Cryptomeria japonica]|uniref:fasciclin-like arabinogalactan protein 4 n=1 Tax=Cryptomeria japonica TaxID=3369 RepID=UPI0025AC3E1A|nr:fasciclin-like arabinogalactan protein 4 [Cryptomeria japonica]
MRVHLHLGHFWCLFFMCIWVSGSVVGAAASGFNITKFLSGYPEFETFNNLLTATNVAKQINNRTSLTILVLSNSVMVNFMAGYGGNPPKSDEIQYVLQYHVLLEYLDWYRFRRMTRGGTLVTTLYQTTGMAPRNFGSVNITYDKNVGVRIRTPAPYGGGLSATVVSLVKEFPYTISIFSIDNILIPYGFDLSTSSEPNDGSINVTNVLENAKNFNFVVSMMVASGVTSDLESDQAGAGITFFAPTDDAFSALPPDTLQGLTAENKAVVLKYHVLHSYYPLGSLESIVNPVQPTLATESMGAGRYTLNITRINGSVTVDTGIVQASITQTVFDQKPLAIFAVPRVLLPREMFGNHAPVRSPENSPSPKVHVPSPVPESSPSLAIPPTPPNVVPNPPSSNAPPAVVPPLASPNPNSSYGGVIGEPNPISPSSGQKTSGTTLTSLAAGHIILASQCICLIYIVYPFLH